MAKTKVLLIDDEVDFTKVVKYNLEEKGDFDVEIVNEAKSAVEKATLFEPDIIFLDLIMPDLEGPDVLEKLRANPHTRGIPVVFLTATITKEEVSTQKGEIGGRAFLAKPSTMDELMNCIQKHATSSSD